MLFPSDNANLGLRVPRKVVLVKESGNGHVDSDSPLYLEIIASVEKLLNTGRYKVYELSDEIDLNKPSLPHKSLL